MKILFETRSVIMMIEDDSFEDVETLLIDLTIFVAVEAFWSHSIH
jgi:hypothetical protein